MPPFHLPVTAALLLATLGSMAAALAQAPRPGTPMVPAINPELLTGRWSARWIAPPGVSPFSFGVYHFRRTLDLPARPASFVVHVSADNRYQLFANGIRVSEGPARGDLKHWRYETVDLTPHLRAGKNVLAAVVWNYGEEAPQAQITDQTGFLLQGDREAERVADTGPQWKVLRNPAYTPLHYSHGDMHGYYVAGPGEQIDGSRYPWGWEQPEYDDHTWQPAQALSNAAARDASDSPNAWMLVPRSIPAMEEHPERLVRIRQASGVTPPAGFPAQAHAFQIPARTKARLLLDQTYLTTAYPELTISGGKGAKVSVGCAEALFHHEGRRYWKGNRDEVEGKEFIGYRDVFLPDGGDHRLYRPLWWRTYRYVDLQVETADAPLTVEDFRGVYTAYPFRMNARFDAGDRTLDRMLEVGWRTARLDAHDTYMDCPYYEQLQYVGDTRIQCLVSLYNSGDARLMRNAIQQIDASRTPEGATMSRAPTRLQQYIPSFSMWWIGMVHDYWTYVDDPQFVKEMLPGVRAVLGFFAQRQKANGSLGPLPWWRYMDWADGWRSGNPPQEADGSSAPFDLQLLMAHEWAAEMEDALGSRARAEESRTSARQLRETIRSLYWDRSRGLFADTPARKAFSQQTNSLAVVSGMVRGDEARRVVERTLEDQTLTPCSFYFRYYLHQAVVQAGLGDRYLDLLGDWKAALAQGFTTWPEVPERNGTNSRSDCHAWSAHPNIELFRTVLGVDSAGSGWSRVRVSPHLGALRHVSGSVPHPRGDVAVSLRSAGEGVQAEVTLPEGVPGEFVWHGERRPLRPGKNTLSFER